MKLFFTNGFAKCDVQWQWLWDYSHMHHFENSFKRNIQWMVNIHWNNDHIFIIYVINMGIVRAYNIVCIVRKNRYACWCANCEKHVRYHSVFHPHQGWVVASTEVKLRYSPVWTTCRSPHRLTWGFEMVRLIDQICLSDVIWTILWPRVEAQWAWHANTWLTWSMHARHREIDTE